MTKKCPKCGYQRVPSDSSPEYECPKCGVIYAKFKAEGVGLAKSTIGAGHDTNTEKMSPTQKSSLIKWAVITVIAAGIGWFGLGRINTPKASESIPQNSLESKLVKESKLEEESKLAEQNEAVNQDKIIQSLLAEVKAKLKDPESAQFRNQQFFASHITYADGVRVPVAYTICGEINAKNSYGGYSGYRRFFSWHILTGQLAGAFAEIEDPETKNEQKKSRFERDWASCKDDDVVSQSVSPPK